VGGGGSVGGGEEGEVRGIERGGVKLEWERLRSVCCEARLELSVMAKHNEKKNLSYLLADPRKEPISRGSKCSKFLLPFIFQTTGSYA